MPSHGKTNRRTDAMRRNGRERGVAMLDGVRRLSICAFTMMRTVRGPPTQGAPGHGPTSCSLWQHCLLGLCFLTLHLKNTTREQLGTDAKQYSGCHVIAFKTEAPSTGILGSFNFWRLSGSDWRNKLHDMNR